MVICLIAEGSYPYITGGVSSWIHALIKGMPDVQFKIISIMPDYKMVNQVHYEPPENLIETKTIYLNDFSSNRMREQVQNIKSIGKKDLMALKQFVQMHVDFPFEDVVRVLNDKRVFKNSMDFFKSDIFWNSMVEVYNERYAEESFNDFFWTFRSIFVSLIYLVQFKGVKADVYHSVSTGYAGFLGSVLRSKTDKKYIITEHGIYPREREEEILKAAWVPTKYKKLWIDYFYFLSKVAYQKSDQIVTLFGKNEMIQHQIGAEPEKTHVIHNAVDLKHLTFREEKKSTDQYVVGAVLRVTPIKDVMTLLRAFKIVKARVQNVVLEIIGPTDEDEDYYEQCVSLVKLLGIGDSVTFTGRVDVKPYYERMDVLVLTSISEGQPLVILEAMAVGIPVVSTDVGSCYEMVIPGTEEACGIITRLVHPMDTANAIVSILQNPEMARKMAVNGRRRVENDYEKSAFLQAYREIYLRCGEADGRNRISTKGNDAGEIAN